MFLFHNEQWRQLFEPSLTVLRLTCDCKHVEVDLKRWKISSLSLTAHKWNDFLNQVNFTFILWSLLGALIKRFFPNYFSWWNSLQVATWNMVYIPLPPFPFNHLVTLPSGTNNDSRWVFTFCLNRWIEIGCTHSASLFYFFKRASLFSGVFLSRGFCFLYFITVDL